MIALSFLLLVKQKTKCLLQPSGSSNIVYSTFEETAVDLRDTNVNTREAQTAQLAQYLW